jgi:hypothetical protein
MTRYLSRDRAVIAAAVTLADQAGRALAAGTPTSSSR